MRRESVHPRQYRTLRDVPKRERIVTIGTFDGVHVGHQALIGAATERARECALGTLLVTFEPIPAMVLRPDKFVGRITTPDEKLARLRDAGLEEIVTLGFSRDFSRLTAEEFVEDLVSRVSPREVWVGEAFALGRDRLGDVTRLTQLGEQFGFDLRALPRQTDDEVVISSSGIRRSILEGDPALAHRHLGRPFTVTGPVVHGHHFGRTIGFPTANVPPPNDLVPLADGIYATRAFLPGEDHSRISMTYVGPRPTVNTGQRMVETHVLDFDGDLYGRKLRVDIYERLRPDAHFETIEAMVEQLHRDEAATRAYFHDSDLSIGHPAANVVG